jgi:hypothetical protein
MVADRPRGCPVAGIQDAAILPVGSLGHQPAPAVAVAVNKSAPASMMVDSCLTNIIDLLNSTNLTKNSFQ